MSNQDRSDLSLYSKLPEQVQENFGVGSSKPRVDPETGSFVREYVGEAIVKGYDKQATFNTKVKNKMLLLDNPPKDTTTKDKSKGKDRKKSKSKALNSREKRTLQVYAIPLESRKYSHFVPLHEMWKGYAMELWGGSAPITFAQKLLKADMHGAIITVTQCKCPSYIGMSGIVVQETEQTFKLITETNALRTIPKVSNVFAIHFGEHVFSIHGNQFRYRGAHRSSKKFKNKPTIDL